MPKKKAEKKEYFIKGKQIITDPSAPVISDEFIDVQPEGEYRGQTIEVQSETKLEDDLGVGSPFVLRSYEFRTDPQLLHDIRNKKATFPSNQELFNAHAKGIAGMLWSDGLTPEISLDPVIIFSKDQSTYLIMVWAKPSLGQSVIDTPKTLSQIVHGSRKNRDKIQ